MAGKDASIYFSVEVDNKDAYKRLDALQKKIKGMQEQLAADTKNRDHWLAQADALAKPLDEARQKLAQMKAAGKDVFSASDISEQKERVTSLEAAWNNAIKKGEHYVKAVQDGESAIRKTTTEAKELTQQIAAAETPTARMGAALARAEVKAEKLTKRVVALAASALVFSVITKAFTALREHMSDVVESNNEASAAVGRLKGALLTLAQPLVDVVLPAFVSLVNILTAVTTRVGQLVAMLFGTTAEEATRAAEALHEETKALEGTGNAAKKASGQLASFDEVNRLGSTGGSAAGATSSLSAPDFSWGEEMWDGLMDIADAVLLIGAGLALWRISSALPEHLGTVLNLLGGILIAVGGVMLLWEGLSDAWENGVDWGNMAAMIAGVAAAATGVYIAFGKIGAGISLVLGGLALLVTGFQDVMEHGANLQNTLLTIAGIVATGLGLYLLTGSVIPLVIAGISSVLFALAAMTGNGEQLVNNLKMVFEGLSDFLLGVFTLDIDKAGEGVCKIVGGAINTVLTLIGTLVNAIIKGLNWLIARINSISFSVPDWVPVIGGKGFAPRISPVKEWKIPQLAQGAVIPPNREFLAVLGDQTRGNNIEAPEDLIRKIVREESGGGNEYLLREILEAIREGKVIRVGKKQLGEVVNESLSDRARAGGGTKIPVY